MAKRYAALPFRKANGGAFEILIITSRDTGRWIIPKGRAEKHMPAHMVAAKEALEEAGVTGKIGKRPIGRFRDGAQSDDVVVYPLKVAKQMKSWRERGQRKVQWLPLRKAAKKVDAKGLSLIVRQFKSKPNRS